jgi:CRISPR/Cas system CMR subunit Cmr6 (Cas7 group RAMP superfamily)
MNLFQDEYDTGEVQYMQGYPIRKYKSIGVDVLRMHCRSYEDRSEELDIFSTRNLENNLQFLNVN